MKSKLTPEEKKERNRLIQQRFREKHPEYNAWQCFNGERKKIGLPPLSYEKFIMRKKIAAKDIKGRVSSHWTKTNK